MLCIDCTEYNNFYTILASNTLTILSMTVVILIYLRQRQSDREEVLENNIKELLESIYRFLDIVSKVRKFDLNRIATTSREEVSQKYIDANRARDFEAFIKYFNTLQFQICENFLDHSRKYQEERIPTNTVTDIPEYEIDTHNFENWLGDVSHDLNDAKKAHESLYKIIIDIKQNWKFHLENIKAIENFYELYWDVLMDIIEKTKKIDKEMKKYNEVWYVWDSGSSISNLCLSFSLLLFSFLGLVMPLYMLQPHKLKILCCTQVFYIIVSLLIVPVLLIGIAYKTRHIYQTHVET